MLQEKGTNPLASLLITEGDSSVQTREGFRLLMNACILCNDADLVLENAKWRVRGDPTEGALVVLAEKAGFHVSEVRSRCPRIGEVPFSSERKRMSDNALWK